MPKYLIQFEQVYRGTYVVDATSQTEAEAQFYEAAESGRELAGADYEGSPDWPAYEAVSVDVIR